jgi:phosphoribosylamine--glycine ligase
MDNRLIPVFSDQTARQPELQEGGQVPEINVLLIGSGGREHALAWKIAASPILGELYVAPGNAGIAELAQCIDLDISDHAAVCAFCRAKSIGLVVIGPEAPLVAGLVDELSKAGIKAFGPTKAAARLEGSKGFTKDLCQRYGIPTARYARIASEKEGLDYVRRHPAPLVVKADGLAGGKGVTVATTRNEAEDAIKRIYGAEAGAEAVIEEFLEGEEASFFALVDGSHAVALATAQDHKRVGENDTGPNTGGMGAYSPAPVMTEEFCQRTMDEIIHPTIAAMRELGTPYKGVLYAGLMITKAGPKLIEYNVRFGDPECQVLMLRLKDDLLTLLLATVEGALDKVSARWEEDASLTVVMAAKGYPGEVRKGSEIGGLDRASRVEGVEIFHAATLLDGGRLIANGGRVLNVTARGSTVSEAKTRAYRAIELIDWPEGFYRRDIGSKAVERERRLVAKRPA